MRQVIKDLYLELMKKYDLKTSIKYGSGGYFYLAALMPFTVGDEKSWGAKYSTWPEHVIGVGILDRYSGYEDIIDYTPYVDIELSKNYDLHNLFEDFVDVCEELKIQYKKPGQKPPELRRDHF